MSHQRGNGGSGHGGRGGGMARGSGSGGQGYESITKRNAYNNSGFKEVTMRADPYTGENVVKAPQSEPRSQQINKELVTLAVTDYVTKVKGVADIAIILSNNLMEFAKRAAEIPDLSAYGFGVINLELGGGEKVEDIVEPEKPEPEVVSLLAATNANAANVNVVRPSVNRNEGGSGGVPPRQGQSFAQNKGPQRCYDAVDSRTTGAARAPHYNNSGGRGGQGQSWKGQQQQRPPMGPSNAQTAALKAAAAAPPKPTPPTPTPAPAQVAVVADVKEKEKLERMIYIAAPRPTPPPEGNSFDSLTIDEIKAMSKEQLLQAKERLAARLKYDKEMDEYYENAKREIAKVADHNERVRTEMNTGPVKMKL